MQEICEFATHINLNSFSQFVYLKECLDLISFLKPQKAYLTHISHNLGLHNVIQAKLPKNVFLAYDGLKINF